MKKQILLLASIVISTLAISQDKISFGIRGGASSAGIKGEAQDNLQDIIDYTGGIVTTGNRTGFYAGPYVNIPLGGKISLEPGVYYAQKGYEMKGAFDIKGLEFLGANAKARLNTQYIDLPVFLKANLGGFQVFAGPQVSYLLQADLRTTAGVFGINLLNKTMDVSDEFNEWDASITGGIGYQFVNGLNVTAAYDHGLSRLDANKNMNAYNRSFKVGLGFSF